MVFGEIGAFCRFLSYFVGFSTANFLGFNIVINQNFRKDRTLIKSDMLENNVCVMFQQIMLSFRCSSHSNIYVFYVPFICSYGVISLSTERKNTIIVTIMF